MNLPFFNIIKEVIKVVKNKNQADPHVKTADPSVFDQIEKHVDNSNSTEPGALLEDLKRNVNHVQRENRNNPNVATADRSVFENMQKELEALKAKMANQNNVPTSAPATRTASTFNSSAPTPTASSTPAGPTNYNTVETKRTPAVDQILAMTNSGGGSLSMRTQPNMGAATMDSRVADSSLVKVIEYSKNNIHLDGKNTRFVKVDVNGQVGWILESYLNFN